MGFALYYCMQKVDCMGMNMSMLSGCAGLLAGVAARAQRREYMQLLADCQRVYCEARLSLVAEVVAARMADYAREALPSLTRSGCSYLMQVCRRPYASVRWDTSKHVQRLCWQVICIPGTLASWRHTPLSFPH